MRRRRFTDAQIIGVITEKKAGLPTTDLCRKHGVMPSRNARDTGWPFEAEGKTESVRMKIALRLSSAEPYVASCGAGLGLIQVPAYEMQDLLRDGGFVTVLPHHRAPAMPVAIVLTDRASLNPALQVFTVWAAAFIKESQARRL